MPRVMKISTREAFCLKVFYFSGVPGKGRQAMYTGPIKHTAE